MTMSAAELAEALLELAEEEHPGIDPLEGAMHIVDKSTNALLASPDADTMSVGQDG